MGVDDRQVQYDEAIGTGETGSADKLLPNTINIGLQGRVRVGRTDIAFDRGRQGRNGPRSGKRCAGGCRLLRIVSGRARVGREEQCDQQQNTAKNHCPSSTLDQP